jgi:uncharacterized protein YqgV (UPF0045/DUF77 family)
LTLVDSQENPRGGTPPADQPYYYVERALDVIKTSGLAYEVEPLGTTIEGDSEAAVATALRAHQAVLDAGADSVITVIKIAQRRQGATTMQDLVGKHRT